MTERSFLSIRAGTILFVLPLVVIFILVAIVLPKEAPPLTPEERIQTVTYDKLKPYLVAITVRERNANPEISEKYVPYICRARGEKNLLKIRNRDPLLEQAAVMLLERFTNAGGGHLFWDHLSDPDFPKPIFEDPEARHSLEVLLEELKSEQIGYLKRLGPKDASPKPIARSDPSS